MKNRFSRVITLPALALMLSACVPQSEVNSVHQDVQVLSQEMSTLQQQTVRITQQNSLNAHSASGVYLLPDAKTPAKLNSQLGMLQMSVTGLQETNDGLVVQLHIHNDSGQSLPAFQGEVAWGQIQGTTQHYDETNVRTQVFHAPATLLAPADLTVELHFPATQRRDVSFIRIHDIQPLNAADTGA